jgi:hypothetical protein
MKTVKLTILADKKWRSHCLPVTSCLVRRSRNILESRTEHRLRIFQECQLHKYPFAGGHAPVSA